MRAAIYCRVSTDEQAAESHSLEAQARACQEYATKRGWQVVTTYTDPGHSGRSMNRPAVIQLRADALRNPRLFDVVIVHKLDRWSRSIKDTITTLDDLDRAGVSFAAAAQAMDRTTVEGKMMMMLLAVFAETYIDNLRQETRKGKKERALKGLYNGSLPFGYERTPRVEGQPAKVPVFHPRNIEGYRTAIRMAADGITSATIAAWFNASGYKTSANRPFGTDAVLDMIQSRFYLGEVSYKGAWMPGKHTAAIDEETWQRAVNAIIRRRARPNRATHRARAYPLRQLLFCDTCHQSLRGWGSNSGKRFYRDTARLKGYQCPHKQAWQAEVIEGELSRIMATVDLPADWHARALQLLEAEDDQGATERQRVALKARMSRAKTLFLYGDIDQAEYDAQKQKLEQQIAELPQPTAQTDVVRAAELLKNFSALWEVATLEEREELLHAMLVKVYVRAGEVVAIAPYKEFWALLANAQVKCVTYGSDGRQTGMRHIVILPPHK